MGSWGSWGSLVQLCLTSFRPHIHCGSFLKGAIDIFFSTSSDKLKTRHTTKCAYISYVFLHPHNLFRFIRQALNQTHPLWPLLKQNSVPRHRQHRHRFESVRFWSWKVLKIFFCRQGRLLGEASRPACELVESFVRPRAARNRWASYDECHNLPNCAEMCQNILSKCAQIC